MAFFFRKLNLYEELNILEETQDLPSDTIYTISPTPAEDYDKHSGDGEDEAEPRDLNRLPARQLRKEAELGKNSESLLEKTYQKKTTQ